MNCLIFREHKGWDFGITFRRGEPIHTWKDEDDPSGALWYSQHELSLMFLYWTLTIQFGEEK